MQRFQSFKYELMPSGDQQRRMRRFAGSCRYVYNRALALQKERFEQSEKRLRFAELCRQLTSWRKNGVETPWLKDSPIHPLQQTLKDLERSYSNFFAKRTGFPRLGWGEFRRQLGYKLAWTGGILIAVPPHHTSTTCPRCKHISPENRKTQAQFRCVACGYTNNADVVAAINIKERGQRLLACGGMAHVGRPAKQAPAEAAQAVVP